MDDMLGQAWEILKHIFVNLLNPEAWQEVLQKPGMFWAVFIVTNLIVFTETGLLIGFFLPGDSLLVTLGIVARAVNTQNPDGGWPLHVLLPCLCLSAIVGDTIGYWIGYRAGPKLFQREESFFFQRSHLLAAQDYYERHGGKTIIIARFMPFVRTFAPVVAGIGKMEYRKFLAYNVVGGIAWILSMFFLGHTLIEMLIKPLVPNFNVAKQIDKIVIVIVFLSVAPMGLKWLSTRFKKAEPATKSIG